MFPLYTVATASIDPENEHLIQEAISALTHGKTIITIAHRLATIENADQILVIDGGTVAQRGTQKQGKDIGYERWAKKHNLKAMSQTLILLQENRHLPRTV